VYFLNNSKQDLAEEKVSLIPLWVTTKFEKDVHQIFCEDSNSAFGFMVDIIMAYYDEHPTVVWK